VIREPEDAVVEFVLLKPALTLAQALRGWVRFYAPLIPYRGSFVTARTDEVLADLGAIIGLLNDRFGTAFASFEPTEGNLAAAQERIGTYFRERTGPGLPLIGRTDTTEQEGQAERERLRSAYRAPRLAPLRERAGHLHETFTKP
jgi:hypothetical protein